MSATNQLCVIGRNPIRLVRKISNGNSASKKKYESSAAVPKTSSLFVSLQTLTRSCLNDSRARISSFEQASISLRLIRQSPKWQTDGKLTAN
jgi:hypothetical protein